MRVRRLDVDEWPLYRTARLATLSDSPLAFGSSADEEGRLTEEAWRRRLAGRVQLVAEVDGEIAGTVGVLDEGDEIAEIVSMWVAPSRRRQGVGEALIVAAVAEAERQGASVVRLWVADGNGPAERLYERQGFHRTGRVQPVREEDPDDSRIEHEMRLPDR